MSKLNEAQVAEIRQTASRRGRKDGVKQKVLAEKYGVSLGTISLVANSNTWKHLT